MKAHRHNEKKTYFYITTLIISVLFFAETGSAAGPCVTMGNKTIEVPIDSLPFTRNGTVDRGCFGNTTWSLDIKHWPPKADEVDFFELKPLIEKFEDERPSCPGQTKCNDVPLVLPFTLIGHYEYGESLPVYTFIAVATCNHQGSYKDNLGKYCGSPTDTWSPKCSDFDPFIGTTYSENTCGGKVPQKHYLFGQGPPPSCGSGWDASWYAMCVEDFTSCGAIGLQTMGSPVSCKDCSSGCPY